MNDPLIIDQQMPAQRDRFMLPTDVGQETRGMSEQARLTSFARFYETSFPRVYRHLLARFGQHEQAEDLAQEVFEKAWRAWPPASTEHLSGWLTTITIRTAHDAWRKKQARAPGQSLEALIGWLGEVASPLDAAEVALSRMAFRGAWSSLPTRQRELLVRSAIGVTLAELAQEEGCHRSTIMQRLARARRTLRQRYQQEAEA